MMEDFDFNIENYNLHELLKLFKLSSNFNKEDLKLAKKMVLRMHPDKSKLDKKYFLFFTKAYKRLFFIYEFKETQNTSTTIEYEDVLRDYYSTYQEQHDITDDMVTKTFHPTDSKKFNLKFNKIFEENRMKNEYQETGYSDWLKTEQNDLLLQINVKNINKDEQLRLLNQYKNNQRQLIKHNGIQELESTVGYSNLINSAPDNYGSDIFSKLPFEDLKKAHEESLIIVGDMDMRKEVFHNIHQLEKHRNTQDVNPLTIEQTDILIRNQRESETHESTQRAFLLAKEAQEANDIHNRVKKYFNLLL